MHTSPEVPAAMASSSTEESKPPTLGRMEGNLPELLSHLQALWALHPGQCHLQPGLPLAIHPICRSDRTIENGGLRPIKLKIRTLNSMIGVAMKILFIHKMNLKRAMRSKTVMGLEAIFPSFGSMNSLLRLVMHLAHRILFKDRLSTFWSVYCPGSYRGPLLWKMDLLLSLYLQWGSMAIIFTIAEYFTNRADRNCHWGVQVGNHLWELHMDDKGDKRLSIQVLTGPQIWASEVSEVYVGNSDLSDSEIHTAGEALLAIES